MGITPSGGRERSGSTGMLEEVGVKEEKGIGGRSRERDRKGRG